MRVALVSTTPPESPHRHFTTDTPPAAEVSRSKRDRTGRALLLLGATGAAIATAATAVNVAEADGQLQVVETWRLFGLPVFAGLLLILAAAPRRLAGLWELVIANKACLVVAGATYLSGTDGGAEFVYVDGALVVLLLTAYGLTRGWSAWTAS